MDNLVMLIFIALAIAGYVRVIQTPGSLLPLRILSVIAIAFCLAPFLVVTLGRIDSSWWTGNARAGYWMIGVMATGFVCLVWNKKAPADA